MVGGHGRSLDEVRWRLLDELLGVGDGDVHRLDAGQCGPVFFAPGEEIHPGPGLRPAGCRGCGWWRFHPLRLSCACTQCSHSLEVHCDGASGDVQYLAGQAEPRTAGITARCARSGEHAPGDYITGAGESGAGESGTGRGKRDRQGKAGQVRRQGKTGQVRRGKRDRSAIGNVGKQKSRLT